MDANFSCRRTFSYQILKHKKKLKWLSLARKVDFWMSGSTLFCRMLKESCYTSCFCFQTFFCMCVWFRNKVTEFFKIFLLYFHSDFTLGLHFILIFSFSKEICTIIIISQEILLMHKDNLMNVSNVLCIHNISLWKKKWEMLKNWRIGTKFMNIFGLVEYFEFHNKFCGKPWILELKLLQFITVTVFH